MIEFARSLNREIKFFEVETLKNTIERYNLTESEFVKQRVGVGNICEAAALSSVDKGRVALPKSKYESVTVALIWAE